MSRLIFMGDCTSIIDTGGAWESMDATQLAQLVEDGLEISREKFEELVELETEHEEVLLYDEDVSFWKNSEQNVAWIYDSAEDIHYFYA